MKKFLWMVFIFFQLTLSYAESSKPLGFSAARKLQYQYDKALSIELEALRQRGKKDLSELKLAQGVALKAWEEKEKVDRKQYFRDHPRSEERRAYIRDFVQRRNNFLKSQEEVKNQRAQSLEIELKALRAAHNIKLKEFKNFLMQGQEPPQELWPQ